MELAAATHHSAPKGGWPHVLDVALRGQTTASSGKRPDVLAEPGAQGWLEAPSRPSPGWVPSASLPHLAGGDAEREEERKVEEKAMEDFQVGSPVSAAPAPVDVYFAPSPAVTFAVPAPVDGFAPVPAVTYAAPAPWTSIFLLCPL